MLVVLVRAILLYAVAIFSLRLMGKRQIGELQPSELVITILISNIVSLPIEDGNIPMLRGMIPVLGLVGFELLAAQISLFSGGFRKVMSGSPVVVIQNGIIDQAAMRKLRFTLDDLMESLRQQGIFRFQDVQYAIVETNGKVSILQKFENGPVSPSMLNLQGDEPPVAQIVLSDGKPNRQGLCECQKDLPWLTEILQKEKVKAKDVFLMTADDTGNYTLIKKERKNEKRIV